MATQNHSFTHSEACLLRLRGEAHHVSDRRSFPQVYRVVKALSGAGLPFRSLAMTGGELDEKERSKRFRTQVK